MSPARCEPPAGAFLCRTSGGQVPQRPEDGEGHLSLEVVEGGQAARGLVRVLHLGAKLIHDVPDGDLVLRRLEGGDRKIFQDSFIYPEGNCCAIQQLQYKGGK